MRPLPPVPFPAGPAFINVLPKRSSSLVVTSNQGLVNIVDSSNPTSANEFYQVIHDCCAPFTRSGVHSHPELSSWTRLPLSILQPSPLPGRIWHSATRMESST